MSRLIDTGEVKALFRQLVKAAGGVEACAAELSISFQRVSHLQNPSNTDEPTFRQIDAWRRWSGGRSSPAPTSAPSKARQTRS
ncbi:MAG: hypothetical protein ACRED4_09530 [Brevundimonas sp.]